MTMTTTTREASELRRALAASDYEHVTVDVGTEIVSISRVRLAALVAEPPSPLADLARVAERLIRDDASVHVDYSGSRETSRNGDGKLVVGGHIVTTLVAVTKDPAYNGGGSSS